MRVLARDARTRRAPWTAVAIGAVLAVAFAVRLVVGMQEPLDADEAVTGIAALRFLHGQPPIMEPDGRYLGALDCYFLAPFLFVLGPTLLAVRLAMSVVGAAYVAAMYWLGRLVLPGGRSGLIVAAVAAVFPLFAVGYGVKARSYGTVLLLEALLLALVVRVLWPRGELQRRDWAAAGLLCGLALWQHPLLALPVGLCVAALALRFQALGPRAVSAGLPWAAIAATAGFSPWLLYNAISRLGSIRHLYSPLVAYSVPTPVAARQVLSDALPIFVGGRMSFCGPETVPYWAVDLAVLALGLAVLWIRRSPIRALLRGRLEPVELVLAIGPLALVAVTLRWFNALSCEPRYLMPFAVPLVLAAALVLMQPGTWRWLGAVAATAWLLMAATTAVRNADLYRDVLVIPGHPVRVDAPGAAQLLAAEHPQALWAEYWLARPIQFYSGDTFVVGEYEGYVGFKTIQVAAYSAAHPSWLFVAGDPVEERFQAECARRGITYRRSEPVPGLVLYADLAQPLAPEDLGLGGQTVRQAD